jgi:3-hydroxypropanoate dehydrogenase
MESVSEQVAILGKFIDHVEQENAIGAAAIETLFTNARTTHEFLDRPIPDALLKRLVEIAELGPTGGNSSPMRLVFVRSAEAKQRLLPAMWAPNASKMLASPITAIIATDARFFEHFEFLFPTRVEAMRAIYNNGDAVDFTHAEAFRNSTLQAAYLIIAARAAGLACGPMSGFEPARVDAAFFPDGRFKTNFLMNLGYAAQRTALPPRLPRFSFSDVARIE